MSVERYPAGHCGPPFGTLSLSSGRAGVVWFDPAPPFELRGKFRRPDELEVKLGAI